MIFNSYIFVLFFLPISLSLFYGAKLISPNCAKITISLVSLFFYGFWDVHNVPLLLFSILFNYLFGGLIASHSLYKKILLTLGIIINLSLLFYYKYSVFFLSIFDKNSIASTLVLPLAISFFTFEQISYLADKYRGYIKENSFLDYLFFITFFPRLIAGPIYYYREYKDKIDQSMRISIDWTKLAIAITLFSFALFKKVIIADRLAVYSDKLYGSALDKLHFLDSWIGSLAYTLQIYFDFSAYSEMALALGLMFGIQLPINFNSPYKSLSIIDFWNRWHMSLSRFIKDYVYIPLGGNRLGEFRQYVNLIITMTIAGLWHGAGWTLIVWGTLYGFFLVINHFSRRLNCSFSPLLSWLVTFLIMHCLWVPFRAESFTQTWRIWYKMVIPSLYTSYTKPQILFVLFALSICLTMPNMIQIFIERTSRLKWHSNLFWSFLTVGAFIASILEMNHVSPFLYFNF